MSNSPASRFLSAASRASRPLEVLASCVTDGALSGRFFVIADRADTILSGRAACPDVCPTKEHSSCAWKKISMPCPHEEWSTSIFYGTMRGISTPSGRVGFCTLPSEAAAAAGEPLAEEVHSLLQGERESTADEVLHLPLAFSFQRGKLTAFLPACRSVGFSAVHVISADGASTGPCGFARGRAARQDRGHVRPPSYWQ